MKLLQVCVNLRVFRLADNYQSKWKSKKNCQKYGLKIRKWQSKFTWPLPDSVVLTLRWIKLLREQGGGRKRAYPALKLTLQSNCMAIHGYTWQYIVIHGNAQLCIVLHGYTWQYIVIHGSTWLYMAIHRRTWLSMVMHGNTWQYMAIHAIHGCK